MLGRRRRREWRYWGDPTSPHGVTFEHGYWRCRCGRTFGYLVWACDHLRDEAETRNTPRRETRGVGGGL